VLLVGELSVPVCGTGASAGIGAAVLVLGLEDFCLVACANPAMAATANSNTTKGRNRRKRVVVIIGGKLLSG
jgi:hypothetical protein